MALHFPLMVNYDIVGFFRAVRIEGGTEPDDLNTYQVDIMQHGGPAGIPFRTWGFTIEHRYGDGAWELVRKCIEHTRVLD